MTMKKAILILSMCFLFAHSASSNEPKLDTKNTNYYPYGKALICTPTIPSNNLIQDIENFLKTRAIVFNDINGVFITEKSHIETDKILPKTKKWTYFGETDDASGYEICEGPPYNNNQSWKITDNQCQNEYYSYSSIKTINRETLEYSGGDYKQLSCKIYTIDVFENIWEEYALLGNAMKDEKMNIQRNKNLF
jgi:hypothetical protein